MSLHVAKVGEVFAVPIDPERWGVAQVVAKVRETVFVAIYSHVIAALQDGLDSPLDSNSLVFLSQAFEGKIATGDWPLIGHAAVPTGLPFPAYREGMSSGARIVDYAGNRSRPANADEAERVPTRTIVNAVVLESALKAQYGLKPWNPVYDGLRPVPGDLTSASLLGADRSGLPD
jgi:Immunity protein 26